MLINLDRTHIKYLNKVISELISLQRENATKGKLSNMETDNNLERLETIRRTLLYVGSVSLDENDYALIKMHLEKGPMCSRS